jgi:hypothetical protein
MRCCVILGSRFPERGRSIGFLLSIGFPLRPARVARLSGLEADQSRKRGKQSVRIYARSLLCHWAICSLGMTAVAVSKLLGIRQPAVTRAAYRDEANAVANNQELVEEHNA